MADISKFLGDPLVAQMNNVLINEQQEEPPRSYIGASGINSQCDRKIWLGYQGHKQSFGADTMRAINDGHNTEAEIVRILRKIEGIQLHTHDNSGKQYGFSMLDGVFKGHYDGVIKGIPQAPKTWHILEVKCVDKTYYNKLKKIIDEHGEYNALKEWRPEYYGQAVCYMYAEKLSRHLTIVSQPGGRKEPLIIRTKQNHRFAKTLVQKAKMISEMENPPPKIGDQTYYVCRMCGFNSICHR